MSSTDATISRICLSCGMCCNGVMFQLVRLQAADSPKALAALGMSLKRKKKGHQFSQPCSFLDSGNCCGIYADRPTRCRLFECRQIAGFRAGELSEDVISAAIRDVQARVARIEILLAEAGNTKTKQSLTERYTRVMALPNDPQHHAATLTLQQRLQGEMQQLNDLLNTAFRLEAIPLPTTATSSPELPPGALL
jgi:Fe-S-cluster containining protein